MAAEGINFVTGVADGEDGQPTLESLRAENDAVILATGLVGWPNVLPVPTNTTL